MNNRRTWLQKIREKMNFTRERLAKELNTSDQLIYQWEAGIRNPSKENRVALAKILGKKILQKFMQEELALLQNSNTPQAPAA